MYWVFHWKLWCSCSVSPVLQLWKRSFNIVCRKCHSGAVCVMVKYLHMVEDICRDRGLHWTMTKHGKTLLTLEPLSDFKVWKILSCFEIYIFQDTYFKSFIFNVDIWNFVQFSPSKIEASKLYFWQLHLPFKRFLIGQIQLRVLTGGCKMKVGHLDRMECAVYVCDKHTKI